MSWTTTDLTAIETAIASGELRVKFSDREVQYRSIDELLKARDVIKGVLSPSSTSGATSCTLASFTKD
jgi:hypothetical protein